MTTAVNVKAHERLHHSLKQVVRSLTLHHKSLKLASVQLANISYAAMPPRQGHVSQPVIKRDWRSERLHDFFPPLAAVFPPFLLKWTIPGPA